MKPLPSHKPNKGVSRFKRLSQLNLILIISIFVMLTILIFKLDAVQDNSEVEELKETVDSLRDDIKERNLQDFLLRNAVDTLVLDLNGMISQYKPQAEFLNEMGFRESRNQYDIVNSYGHLGKYQFSPRTLKGLGFDCTNDEFLNNPLLQEQAMITLMKYNKKQLKSIIDKYNGKFYNGVYVTESGILAAAHLGGAGSVQKYFRGDIDDFNDAYGTSMVKYLETFAGYRIEV